MLQNFRTYQLAKELYKDCQNLKLHGEIRDQLNRAALSIPLNLAEGSAKPTVKDRKKFYFIAMGSIREVQAILDMTEAQELAKKADIVAAHCHKLCRGA